MTADAFSRLMTTHRSIRAFQDKGVDPALVNRVLVEALQGSSSSGNLNMVSVIKTVDVERKKRLCELHFDQPMVLQAPLVLTFCADSHRTRSGWRSAARGWASATSSAGMWRAIDAIILAQTTALALESHGLGICYMGTTLHSMGAIAEFLECPTTACR
jgi:nitroreductase